MNYVLKNFKLVLCVASICFLPAIYFANKAPAMKDCQTEHAKQLNKEIDEFQSKIKIDDGQHF